MTGDATLLADACAVMDVLGGDAKQTLIFWFIKRRLSEYTVCSVSLLHQLTSIALPLLPLLLLQHKFVVGTDISHPLKVERRYAWLKRSIAYFDQECANVFPA